MTVADLLVKTDDYDTLGGRLSRGREAKGFSLQQLAKLVGVEVRTLKAWETDRNVPRSNRLAMLAGALGVSVSWLLYGRGASPIEEGAATDDLADDAAEVEATRAQLDQLKSRRQKISTEISNIEETLRQSTSKDAG